MVLTHTGHKLMHTHETSHLYNLTISSYTLAHTLLVCAIISHNDIPHPPSYSPHPLPTLPHIHSLHLSSSPTLPHIHSLHPSSSPTHLCLCLIACDQTLLQSSPSGINDLEGGGVVATRQLGYLGDKA